MTTSWKGKGKDQAKSYQANAESHNNNDTEDEAEIYQADEDESIDGDAVREDEQDDSGGHDAGALMGDIDFNLRCRRCP